MDERTRLAMAKLLASDNEGLDTMPHQQLVMKRSAAEQLGDKQANELLAPFEHQAFTREWVKENPLHAIPAAVAPLVYYLAKQPGVVKLGQAAGVIGPDATPANFDQVFGAWRGIGQGLSSK